jgi:hypothetical protein
MQHLRYSFASKGELRNCFHLALGRNYITEQEAGDLMESNASIRGRTKDPEPRTD